MYDLVSIGSISVDLFFKGDSLTYKNDRFQLAIGGKYLAKNFYFGIGGGGANVAIGGARLGLKSAVMGKIGNNSFKRIILSKLIESNVSYSLCDFEDDYYNVSSILLSPNGERSIIHYATPHQHLFNEENELKGLTKAKIVYLGNLPDVSISERAEFLHFLKKKNITTILNLGVSDCRKPLSQLKRLLNATSILIINGYEFADLAKAQYKDINFNDQVIKWYTPFLTDQTVIITEGEKGSFAYFDNQIVHEPAEKIKTIVDSTGAGDGFTAGFIAGYLKTKDIKSALKTGSKFAVKILSKIGAN